MKVGILRAFREVDGDEDPFSKWLRVLRVAYCAVLFGAVMLMVQSAWYVGYERKPFGHTLNSIVFTSIIMFLFYGSFSRSDRAVQTLFASTPWYVTPRVVLITSTIVIVLIAAEATTLLDWWDLKEILVSWRKALLILLGGWLFLWAGEKTIQILRSKLEHV